MEKCRPCGSAKVVELNAEILAGLTPLSQIADTYRLSYSSVRRHAQNHVSRSIMAVPEVGEGKGPAELLRRYVDALDDAHNVREFAIAAQRPELLLRASKEVRNAVEYLMGSLGVDHVEILDELERGRAYTSAIGALVVRSPSLGMAVALQLRNDGYDGIADDVEDYSKTRQRVLDRLKKAEEQA